MCVFLTRVKNLFCSFSIYWLHSSLKSGGGVGAPLDETTSLSGLELIGFIGSSEEIFGRRRR